MTEDYKIEKLIEVLDKLYLEDPMHSRLVQLRLLRNKEWVDLKSYPQVVSLLRDAKLIYEAPYYNRSFINNNYASPELVCGYYDSYSKQRDEYQKDLYKLGSVMIAGLEHLDTLT